MLEASPCRLISCVSDDPDQPEFVWIDPERCLWGDPVMDFVTMGLGIWKLSEKTEAMEAYNELAEFPVTGTREEEIRYAFGLCYLGVIMDSEKHYRYSPELPRWQVNIDGANMFCELGFSMLENEQETFCI